MKTLLVLLFACFLNSASAKNYYFSAVSGDDSRTSIEAQNPSTPWKTLSKLNSFFSNLQPGDHVLLKRGETFYGSITVNKSGTAGAPIVISDYGTGNRPVITSLVTLSGWQANSSYSGVYESDANSAFDAEVNIVLLNGEQEPIGRYPNSDLPNKGYLTFESHVSNTSITDNQLSASPNWTGADVVIRTSRWTMDAGLITSHSGTRISHKAAGYAPRDGYGYFIQNHIRTLDQLGEWYYNPSTKKISMYFGGNNPSSYSVQAATIENLVFSGNRNYVGFDNITFKGATGHGVYIMSGSNNYVNNCDVLFSGIDGVKASGTNFRLENSNVLNSNNNGVNVSSGIAPLIRNNIVKNSYTIAGMGQSGNGQGAGIRNGNKGLVEYNQILNSGYVGVQLGSDYAVVKNNLIDNFCYVKDDGGGIYTSNGPNITSYGRKITGNIILNAIGAGAGTSSQSYSAAEGIYMDDNANGVEITGNTVANCNRGMFFHNSRGIILKGNSFYNNANSQLFMKHDDLGNPLRNHTITNNIFFAKIPSQIVASFTTKVDDFGLLGRLDSNYYARPIDDQITFYNHIYNQRSGQLISHRDLEGWKTKYGHDDVSRRSAKKISPYHVKGIVGANKFANEAFNSSIGNIPQGSCVASWSNAGLLDGGYLKIVPTAVGSSIVISVGTLTAGKNYLLRYSVKGAGDLSLSANLRSASYNPNTAIVKRTITTTRTENEILFSPTTNESTGTLVFKAEGKTTYYLDNIQLYEANASKTNADDSIKFVYNASNLNKTVSLNGSYVDVKNNRHSNSVVLKPYESAILIRDGGTTTALPKEAPTVNITNPGNNNNFASPASIIINANAIDADGSVSKVDFYNGTTLLGSDNISPYSFTWDNVSTGDYSLTAKATDNDGLETSSSAVEISLYTPNGAPTVRITSPINNANFASPASITISATAEDAGGSVSKVDFYNGSTLLGTDNTSPYIFTWNNVENGNYSLTAIGYDDIGSSTVSSVVVVVVSSAPPALSFTPTPISFWLIGQNVTAASKTSTLSANTGSPTVTLTKSANSNWLVLPTSALGLLSFNTTNASALAPGKYTSTVTASAAGYTDATIQVILNIATPALLFSSTSVSFSLVQNSTIGNNNSILSANIGIPTVTLTKSANSNWLVLPSSALGLLSFRTTNASALAPGTYTSTVTASAAGYADATVQVTLTITPPALLFSPTPISFSMIGKNLTAANKTSTLSANIGTPSVTLTKSVNSNWLVLPASTLGLLSFKTTNASALAPGTYTSTVTASATGYLSTTLEVTITVSLPPRFAYISFTGSPVNQQIDLSWSTNNSGNTNYFIIESSPERMALFTEIARVSAPSGSSATLNYDFSDLNPTIGSNYYRIVQVDNLGEVVKSEVILISYETALNTAPTVNITTPTNNASYTGPATITVEAIADDADGTISKVEYYNGTTLFQTEYNRPYVFTWGNVPAGVYSLTAKAYDNKGLITTSASVTVTVSGVTQNAPTVSITNPLNNATYTGPATIKIEAIANDADGTISKVEFYNGTTLLNTETGAPWLYTWNNVPAGNYTITAKATDNDGITASASVTVTVSGVTQNAPTVSITDPLNNAKYTGPATINIEVIASDANGTIKKVEFYNGTTLLWTETGAPWAYTWKNVPAGDYSLTAKAYDNSGLVTTSGSVSVTVSGATQNAPTVRITNPINNAKYTGPATINIEAVANDADGTIRKVEFYNGTTLLWTETGAPWAYTWKNVPVGNYTLTVKAIDNDGNVTTSAALSISVNNSNPVIGNSVLNPISNTLNNSALSLTPGMENSGNYTEPVSIKVGPNPATNTISVFTTGLQKDKELRISVLSISGVMLKSINATTSNRVVQVDITSLINGIYFIKIMSGDMVVLKRFVK